MHSLVETGAMLSVDEVWPERTYKEAKEVILGEFDEEMFNGSFDDAVFDECLLETLATRLITEV
jgi:hypothetical protein